MLHASYGYGQGNPAINTSKDLHAEKLNEVCDPCLLANNVGSPRKYSEDSLLLSLMMRLIENRKNEKFVSTGKKIHEIYRRPKHFQKTKLCPRFLEASCSNGSNCFFAHNEEELVPLPDLRHTKLCSFTKRGEHCPTEGCTYAHSVEELKILPESDTYKTSCCTFWLRSKCFNGNKCRFAHGEHEIRGKSPVNQDVHQAHRSPFATERQHTNVSNKASSGNSFMNVNDYCLPHSQPSDRSILFSNYSSKNSQIPLGLSRTSTYTLCSLTDRGLIHQTA